MAGEEHNAPPFLLAPLHPCTFPFFHILMPQYSCVHFLHRPLSVFLFFSRPYTFAFTPTTPSPNIANVSGYLWVPKSHQATPHLITLQVPLLASVALETAMPVFLI